MRQSLFCFIGNISEILIGTILADFVKIRTAVPEALCSLLTYAAHVIINCLFVWRKQISKG